MKKNGNSRTSLLLEQDIITTCRHPPLIDPMVLIILILPMLVLLFLVFLSHVPNFIKPASFQSTLSCFNIFLVLLVILFRTFEPKVDGPSTNKVVENDQNLDVEDVNDESHFHDSVDWLMSDEEIDASGNSDDQRTPIPPIIDVNSYKLDLQVSDATAKITSSDDHKIKIKRRQYRPKVKNIRRAMPIPPAPPPPRAPSLAQAPAPAQGKKSIFQITSMFKKPRKATHIPFVATTVPPLLPPPPPPSRSLFPNFFTSRNKVKKIPSSKKSILPPTRPPPQPEPQRYEQQSSICSSSESSYLPPPLPPLNTPEMKENYYGDFVRLGSYNSNTSSSLDFQPMGQPATFIKDWMIMTDEAMDASGNSDDQRTPTPPLQVHWLHVNYNKPDPQVSDDTNEKSSSDDQSYDTKRKRKPYRLRLRNKRRGTSSIRAVRRAQAQAPAQALAPAPAPTPPASIFRSMFKKQNKNKPTHSDTAAPTPPPPLPLRSFLNNIFKPRNKNKKHPLSKTSPLPPLPPTRSRPPPQPKPQPQVYERQSSLSSSSQSSYIPQPPPLPPFDMPLNRYKYIGDYARLRSLNSNTSSSPDLQPMGQPSTSTDSGDMLLSSPDVNAKAAIFISKGKDLWKIEQENRVEKRGGPSFVNKPNINKYN